MMPNEIDSGQNLQVCVVYISHNHAISISCINSSVNFRVG